MPDSELLDLVTALVAIPSVNPQLAASGTGERAIAAFAAGWLRERGFEVELVGRATARPSVIAVATGSGGGRSVLLNGHLDTVGVDGFPGDAFAAVVEGGRLSARGAYDMKSGLAAAMVAAARAADAALRGDVVLTLVADEEFGSTGTEDALAELARRGIRPDGAVVVEPTGLALTVAHRGFAWYRLEVEGVAAHGSQPELGVDAIAGAATLLGALRTFGEQLAARPAHPLLGHSTVRVATIAGGTDAATVAAHCTLTLERRTLPGEQPAAVLAELRAVLAAAADDGVGTGAGIRHRLIELVARPAFEAVPGPAGGGVDHDARGTDDARGIVEVVSAAFQRETGRAPELRGDPWWTDAGLLSEAGIPCVLLGVDGGGAHADDEWVDLASVETLARVLERAISDVCG